MGADGWLGIGWPKEYGGQGRSPIEQFIFFDEAQRAGCADAVPDDQHRRPDAHAASAPTSRSSASCRGSCAASCTSPSATPSPSAGTDLASLRTRAVRDGDEYVINGQKIFTSLADYADYIWLAVRTDPDAPKHKGISIFIVPTRAPGFTLTPIRTMGGGRTNATYYDDVRVPVANARRSARTRAGS